MSSKLLNDSTKEEFYKEISINPNFMGKLDEYELESVKLFAIKKFQTENQITEEPSFNLESYKEEYEKAGRICRLIDDYLVNKKNEKTQKSYFTLDRLWYELITIETIFKLQTGKYREIEQDSNCKLFSHITPPIEGYYFDRIDIFSNVSLFNLQDYKIFISENSEKKPIINEIKEILEYAKDIEKHYSKEIAEKRGLLEEQILKAQKDSSDNEVISEEKNYAIIWIQNYHINKVRIDKKDDANHFKLLEEPACANSYHNSDLINICLLIKDFIEKFDLDKYAKKQPDKKEVDEQLMLTDILKKTSYWSYLKDELAKRSLIDINTGIANDEKKGNISLFIALVKHLHSKEYYVDNKKPTNNEVLIILKNTFGITCGIDSCKRTKGTDHIFDFIKYAT